ncbi:MAG TPA: hypothetical protein VIL85_03335 [Thermomicrobiales bacterium]|jgi:hypothetical protein
MDTLNLSEQIELLFAGNLRAETSLGIAARLGVDEDTALVELVGLVTSGALTLIEEGGLLIFLTPSRSREVLELAA